MERELICCECGKHYNDYEVSYCEQDGNYICDDCLEYSDTYVMCRDCEKLVIAETASNIKTRFGENMYLCKNCKGDMKQRILDILYSGFCQACFWVEYEDAEAGLHLDVNYHIFDIDVESVDLVMELCSRFYDEAEHILNDYDTYKLEYAGHDLYFTTFGHGVGFWDRPEVYGEDGCMILNNIVEKHFPNAGNCVYITDENKVYIDVSIEN